MIPAEYTEKLEGMTAAGKMLSEIVFALAGIARPGGITTAQLDWYAGLNCDARNCESLCKNAYGFPGYACLSVNEEVVHGVPNDRMLQDGDLLTIDMAIKYNGWASDMAITIPIGQVSKEHQDMIMHSYNTLASSIRIVKPGLPIKDLLRNTYDYAKRFGYQTCPGLLGHGIGKKMHELPHVPNHPEDLEMLRHNPTLQTGQAICIEPHIKMGLDKWELALGKIGHPVYSTTGQISSQFEHTVFITEDGYKVLTAPDDNTWAKFFGFPQAI